jgi:hypothetical protein
LNASEPKNRAAPPILRLDARTTRDLASLLEPFGMVVREHPPGVPLPGSFWGAPEAGLVGYELHVSPDTPLHSALHEACHFLCMDPTRRARLHTDAGGDDLEESAVCFLQILMADEMPGVGRDRLMADMDAWGYSFRLGSTRAWFPDDAGDARAWLEAHGLIDEDQRPTWTLRGEPAARPTSPHDTAQQARARRATSHPSS